MSQSGPKADRLIYVGESLKGEGNEVAHIDLMFGPESGPVGVAFANALTRESEGHTNLLAVVEPNLVARPYTVQVNKVTIAGFRQAVQHFGPAQTAVAKAIADFFEDKPEEADSFVCVVNVFIHPGAGLKEEGKDENGNPKFVDLTGDEKAASDKKIYDYNYEATKESCERAWTATPTPKEVTEKKGSAAHPFKGFKDEAAA